MVFNDPECIFIHVPKTGGCSVEEALCGGPLPSEIMLNQEGYLLNYQHAFLWELEAKPFSFAFVRNPWDRCVSFYHHLLRVNELSPDYSFLKMVHALKSGETIPSTSPHSPLTFMLPCTAWTEGVDFVGRMETLQVDFDILCDKLGISHRLLPLLNTTEHLHYSTYYDETTKAIVADLYAEDILAYGYEFEENYVTA